MLRHRPIPSALLPILSCVVLALASCGGGSSTQAGGVGSGGTGSYTNGPISGLGSIIVNGVRYDVSGSNVQIVDDKDAAQSETALLLGMLVQVQGSTATTATDGVSLQAQANKVRYASDLVGTVDSTPGAPLTTLSVLGQTVTVNSKTVLPATNLARNDTVAVYGLLDASGAYIATRIERLTSASEFKIAGEVKSINTTSKLLAMGQNGSVLVSYSALAGGLPDGLKVGDRARVWFSNPKTSGNAYWTATRVRPDSAPVQDVDEARLEGVVTQTPDVNRQMLVNGSPVDVSRVSRVPALTVGTRVKVEGSLQAGVLVATSVSVESDDDIKAQEIELHGNVSGLDVNAGTFVLRGITVDYKTVPATLSDGVPTAGKCFEAKGTSYNALGQLLATKVQSDSSCH